MRWVGRLRPSQRIMVSWSSFFTIKKLAILLLELFFEEKRCVSPRCRSNSLHTFFEESAIVSPRRRSILLPELFFKEKRHGRVGGRWVFRGEEPLPSVSWVGCWLETVRYESAN